MAFAIYSVSLGIESRPSNMVEDLLKRWRRRAKIDVEEKRITRLKIYDIDTIKKYMELSLDEAIDRLARELAKDVFKDEESFSALKVLLRKLAEEIRKEIVLPVLESKNVKYDEDYVEALIIEILAILLRKGGYVNTEAHRSLLLINY